jgi:transcriptional regulator with GAF, ATPase, and Fis domain
VKSVICLLKCSRNFSACCGRGQFERLGGTQTIYSDSRLVAPQPRGLHAMVLEQQFRADLFYGVNVSRSPSSARAPEDPDLVRYFVQNSPPECAKTSKRFREVMETW